jgi:hypothetical protein
MLSQGVFKMAGGSNPQQTQAVQGIGGGGGPQNPNAPKAVFNPANTTTSAGVLGGGQQSRFPPGFEHLGENNQKSRFPPGFEHLGDINQTPRLPGDIPGLPSQPSGPSVYDQSAGAYNSALLGTQQAMGFKAPQASASGYNAATSNATGYDAATSTAQGYDASLANSRGYDASQIAGTAPITEQNVQAGQIAGSNLSAYTNPYENQVVGQALGDIERSRLMQQNQLGAQASAAGAFGGSRQGIAEAETNRAFADQSARTASGLRQSGYANAQQMAGQDIASRMQASLANQGANLSAQGQTAGNTLASQQFNSGALNQAGQFGAGAANAASMANQNALNQAGQFGASAMNASSLANQNAFNQAGQFNAGAMNNASMQNQNAFNQAGQFNAGAMNNASRANQQAAISANQQRLAAANQMGGLSQTGFNFGNTIADRQQSQGALQQGIQQMLIDAGKGQYDNFTNAPMGALQANLAAAGAANMGQNTQTSQKSNGLLDYLGVAGGLLSSDNRLKTDVKPIGTHKGVNLYTWNWNDEGKRIADPAQPTVGVMAQELRKTHPHLVKVGSDGYLRVNYAGLNSEMEAA